MQQCDEAPDLWLPILFEQVQPGAMLQGRRTGPAAAPGRAPRSHPSRCRCCSTSAWRIMRSKVLEILSHVRMPVCMIDVFEESSKQMSGLQYLGLADEDEQGACRTTT